MTETQNVLFQSMMGTLQEVAHLMAFWRSLILGVWMGIGSGKAYNHVH